MLTTSLYTFSLTRNPLQRTKCPVKALSLAGLLIEHSALLIYRTSVYNTIPLCILQDNVVFKFKHLQTIFVYKYLLCILLHFMTTAVF